MWNLLILFIVILIIVIVWKFSKEPFSDSSSKNSISKSQQIYNDQMKTQWDYENQQVELALAKLNLPEKTLDLTGLTTMNDFLNFPFYKSIETNTRDYLNKALGPDYQALTGIVNVKTNTDKTVFVLDMTVNSNKHYYTRQVRLKINIVVDPSHNFLLKINYLYAGLVSVYLTSNDQLPPLNQYTTYDNMVNIENELGLFYPFHTTELNDALPNNMVQAAYEDQIKRTLLNNIKTPQTAIEYAPNSNPIFDLSQKGQCFDNQGNVVVVQSQEECALQEGQSSISGSKPLQTTWDTPALSSQVCPYYKKNTNYTNFYGGTVNGFCQLPLNMKNMTYTQATGDSTPLCYNCKTDLIGQGTLGTCCQKQFNNAEYLTLASPDYAFDGDQATRKQQSYELLNKGLSLT